MKKYVFITFFYKDTIEHGNEVQIAAIERWSGYWTFVRMTLTALQYWNKLLCVQCLWKILNGTRNLFSPRLAKYGQTVHFVFGFRPFKRLLLQYDKKHSFRSDQNEYYSPYYFCLETIQ